MKTNIVSYIGSLVKKLEPEYTIRLADIIYSKSHGHEICVMQLSCKNAFPRYTAEELLADPSALIGLSPQDAVTITRLDQTIKDRKGKYRVLEVDKNGTILLRDASGKEKRYSENLVSFNREMIQDLASEDAHDLGYRVGFKQGFNAKKVGKYLSRDIKTKLMNLIPFISKNTRV